MTDRHVNHKIMSLASWPIRADNALMTITAIPRANPTDFLTDRRDDSDSPAAPIRTLRRRLATWVRDVLRDRQPMATVSEQVLSDIHNVHSVHR